MKKIFLGLMSVVALALGGWAYADTRMMDDINNYGRAGDFNAGLARGYMGMGYGYGAAWFNWVTMILIWILLIVIIAVLVKKLWKK